MADFRPGIDLPKKVEGRSSLDISPNRNKPFYYKKAWNDQAWRFPQESETEIRLKRLVRAIKLQIPASAGQAKLIARYAEFIDAVGETSRCTALAALRDTSLQAGGNLGAALAPLWRKHIDLLADENPDLARQVANDTILLTAYESPLEFEAEAALERFQEKERCRACPTRPQPASIPLKKTRHEP